MTHGQLTLADGHRIHYELQGAAARATPLLLLRPLGGSVALWGEFRDRLARERPVIAFDHLGTGGSRPGAARSCTRALASDALGVLDGLGLARAHVFGISLGGMTACWLACDAPERVASLCVASAPVTGVALTHAGLVRGARLARSFVHRANHVERALVRRVLSRRFEREQPGRLAEIERIVGRAPTAPRDLLRLAAAGALHDARAALPRVRARTLVLAGDEDGLLGPAAVWRLGRALSAIRCETLERAGHDLTLERPQETALRVSRFLADG